MDLSFKTTLKHIEENSAKVKTYWPGSYTPEENLSLIKALEKNTTVKSIEVYEGSWSDEHLFLFSDVIANNTGMQSIFIKNISEKAFLYFLEKSVTNKTIKDLDLFLIENQLEITKETAEKIKAYLIANPNLASLTIHVNNKEFMLSDSTIQELCEGLIKSNLKTLSLYHTKISPEAFKLIAALFAKSKTLSNLVLYDCDLHDNDLTYFSEELKSISKVKIFVILKNPITHIGLEELANTIKQNNKLHVHYTVKNEDGSLMRFESEYITPYIQRDSKKVLSKFYYLN